MGCPKSEFQMLALLSAKHTNELGYVKKYDFGKVVFWYNKLTPEVVKFRRRKNTKYIGLHYVVSWERALRVIKSCLVEKK